ncbi:hypothetical protein HanPI659440_Chr17g0702611 [Helianthus annuus]|nr:hypothetical protein HanPI659440_Chr17g0702611 [Helianthus annuus]
MFGASCSLLNLILYIYMYVYAYNVAARNPQAVESRCKVETPTMGFLPCVLNIGPINHGEAVSVNLGGSLQEANR